MSVIEATGVLAWFAAGVVGWTLAEWALHGLVFHSRRLRNPFAREHARHHAKPSYFVGWPRKIPLLVILVAALTTGLRPVLGLAHAAAFACGLGLMYVYYETLHRVIHARAPRTGYGRWARLHHVHHHFHAPRRNFGVSTPIWDRVFGTYVPFETPLAVPERHALPWMLDAATGGLAQTYARDYVLTRRLRDWRESSGSSALPGSRP